MKHYLSIATSIKTIFRKDELDWFLWHKYLGVDHFYIIDDGTEPPVAEILEPYANDITYFNIENKNKLIDKEFWFENEEDAHKFKSHIDSKMEATIIYAPQLEEPFELECEDE